MTVDELIEKLRECDPDAQVVLDCDDGFRQGAARQVESGMCLWPLDAVSNRTARECVWVRT